MRIVRANRQNRQAFINQFSMFKIAKSFNRSCLIVLRKKFLISFSLLKDLSAEATVTGNVQNIPRAMQTFGNISASLNLVIFSKRLNGLDESSPKLAEWIALRYITSSINSSWEISFTHSFARVTQAVEICCSVKSRYLQRKPNMLSILYAASYRVERPAITESSIT